MASAIDVGVSSSSSSSAGGGNVFNAAPLFGSLFGQTGTTAGDNRAGAASNSLANKSAAELAQGAATPAAGGGGVSVIGLVSSYLPYLLIGGAALILVFGAVEIFKNLKK